MTGMGRFAVVKMENESSRLWAPAKEPRFRGLVSVPKQKLYCNGYDRKWQCSQETSRGILIGRGVAIDTISFGGKKFLENDLRTIRKDGPDRNSLITTATDRGASRFTANAQ